MDDRYGSDGRPVGTSPPRAGEVLSDLRTRLREAADEHRPDRERILARVERGMAKGPERPGTRREKGSHRLPIGPAPWARVVGVTAGLVGAFGIGGLAVGLTNDGGEQRQTVVTSPGPVAPPDVPPPTVSPSDRPVAPPPSDEAGRAPASVTPGPSKGGDAGKGSPSAGATPPTSPDTRRGNHPQDSYLWSDGSVAPSGNDYWARSDVTLKSYKPLTRLTVVLRIAQTGGVSSTGAWSTLSHDDYDVSIRRDRDAVIYLWTLRSGRTLPAGTHVFAGQYNHAQGGRDSAGDVYAARGDGPSGAMEVRGDFH